MRGLCACLLLLTACGTSDPSRIGRPGDPGYVDQAALGASRASTGPIHGTYAGATFHVAYYEQPDAPPIVGLDYGAYEAASGSWLHVALFASGELPAAVDLARYQATGPDGESERAQVELADAAPDAQAVARDLRRARSGRLVIQTQPDHIAITLEDLAFDAGATQAPPPTSGSAEGDVRYECWRYDPHSAPSEPRKVGRHLLALPNPGDPGVRYAEDRDMSSDFCRATLP
jgi:hypothetical protein